MSKESKAQLAPTDALTFCLAGNARVTFLNTDSGNRFTYQIQQAKPDHEGQEAPPLWFVRVLTGSDNTADYQYLGVLRTQGFQHGVKSKISVDAQSCKVFSWVWPRLQRGTLPGFIQVWHEGRCGKCNRVLTDPLSISLGMGPTCRGES